MESASPDEQRVGLEAPHRRGRRLFPYERRLVAWQLRRWRANPGIAELERQDGLEMVQLLAAHSAGYTLGFVIGAGGVVLGFAVQKLFGSIPGLAVYGASLCAATFILVTATRRSQQSRRARDEYQRGKPVTGD
jgi:hypothetical protein